jgi:hypothetical protein
MPLMTNCGMALAGAGKDFLSCAGHFFDIYFFVRNVVLGEKSFGDAAVRAAVG